MQTGFWWGHLRERDHLEDLGAEGRIILKFVFKECDGEAWIGLIWFRIQTTVGTCNCGNELPGSVKYGSCLD